MLARLTVQDGVEVAEGARQVNLVRRQRSRTER